MSPRFMEKLRQKPENGAEKSSSVLWEFRGLTPDVGVGLVPVPCEAITRVARTTQPQRTISATCRLTREFPKTLLEKRTLDPINSLTTGNRFGSYPKHTPPIQCGFIQLFCIFFVTGTTVVSSAFADSDHAAVL